MHSSLYPYGERTLARVHRSQWLNPLGHKGRAGKKDIRRKNDGYDGDRALLVLLGWRPVGLSVHLPLLSSPCTMKPRRWHVLNECWVLPHGHPNRRWGNPARVQHNTVLKHRVVFMKFGGLVNCGKTEDLGFVPGTLTH